MNDMDKILHSSVNPETKVYMIARLLQEAGRLHPALWYAVLELKDKHLSELQIKSGPDGTPEIIEAPLPKSHKR